jgi:2'-5' RNA ligase
MKFAIEICFDDATTHELIDVWNLLRAKGLAEPQTSKRPYLPHISLAVTPNLDTEKFSAITQEIAQKHRPFNLLFAHLGLFRSEKEILFVAPKIRDPLTALYLDVFNRVTAEKIELWYYYYPERWIPHCAITARNSYDEICEAVRAIEKMKIPFNAVAERLVLVNFVDGDEVCSCKLV